MQSDKTKPILHFTHCAVPARLSHLCFFVFEAPSKLAALPFFSGTLFANSNEGRDAKQICFPVRKKQAIFAPITH